MSGTASDSDAETVITEGTTDGGKVNKEKGKVSHSTVMSPPRAQAEPFMSFTGSRVSFHGCLRPFVLNAVFGERIVPVSKV